MNNWFFKKQKIAAFLAACGSDATNDRMGHYSERGNFYSYASALWRTIGLIMELDHSNLLNEFEDFGLTPNLKVLIKCKCVFLNLS